MVDRNSQTQRFLATEFIAKHSFIHSFSPCFNHLIVASFAKLKTMKQKGMKREISMTSCPCIYFKNDKNVREHREQRISISNVTIPFCNVTQGTILQKSTSQVAKRDLFPFATLH